MPHREDSVSTSRNTLKAAGLRVTPARLAVLSFLEEHGRPASAPQITRILRRLPADRATVYRTLDALLEKGIIHQAYIKDGTAFFELPDRCGEAECHPHFICRSCRSVQCLEGTTTGTGSWEVPEGFVVERRKILLSGLCPECAGKERSLAK